ncbi:MAG: hypothetical protein BM564_12630 [Bacteroidetes bacterium MedPE-SWsnd-G2]|nr:MAG: hypothetical protein BM564_12630 [Bacteroidetes bacterium MedPE-SWsnd-G2]
MTLFLNILFQLIVSSSTLTDYDINYENNNKEIHALWNTILQSHVDPNGNVNYQNLKSNSADFEDYLQILSNTKPSQLNSENAQIAFWINTYNAYTLKLIVDNYPVKSIKDIKKAWTTKFITIGTKFYSLNEIEHDILRTYNKPEIHFAINCASRSCPPLYNRAFSENQLDTQLKSVTSSFLNSRENLMISDKKLVVSKLFKWYSKDFKAAGGVIAFINTYSDEIIPKNIKIEYLPYNWELNE